MMSYTPEREAWLERRTRYLFRRLIWFWPIVTNVDDVERVTLLGYWVCVSSALLNFIQFPILLIKRAPSDDLAWGAGLSIVALIFYFIGGNALRMRSFPAAAMLAIAAFCLMVSGYILHGHFDWQASAQFFLFLNILRGIYLASHYQPAEGEGPPLRLMASFGHGIVDRLPQHIWPQFRTLFWILGGSILTFYVIGTLINVGMLDPLIQRLQH